MDPIEICLASSKETSGCLVFNDEESKGDKVPSVYLKKSAIPGGALPENAEAVLVIREKVPA